MRGYLYGRARLALYALRYSTSWGRVWPMCEVHQMIKENKKVCSHCTAVLAIALHAFFTEVHQQGIWK